MIIDSQSDAPKQNLQTVAHSKYNINPTREASMPKSKKHIGVRDQKPKEDPKGGHRQHRHIRRERSPQLDRPDREPPRGHGIP